jgi:hypothetical protein
MNLRYAITSMLLTLSLVLASCGGSSTPKPQKTGDSTTTDPTGTGTDAEKGDPSAKDPATAKTSTGISTPAPVANWPDTAEGTVKAIVLGVQENQPGVLWQALPASYQKDVNDLVKQFAGSMDAELYDKVFVITDKAIKLLKDKKEVILEASKEIDQPVDRAKLDAQWDSIIALLNTIQQSDLSKMDKLKQMDVGVFLSTTGAQLMKQVDGLANLVEGDPLTNMVKPGLKSLTVEKISGDDTTAELKITIQGDSQTIPFVKVEGKWLPKDMVENWAEGITMAKQGMSEQLPMMVKENKEQAMAMLVMAETAIDGLAAAKDQAATDQAMKAILGPLLAAQNSAKQARTASEMRGLFQGFVIYAQSNKGWYPDSDPQGKRNYNQAETFHQMYIEDVVTAENLVHPKSDVQIPADLRDMDEDKRIAWFAKNSGYVFIHGRKESLKSDEIFLFEKLQYSDGEGLTICWNDGHISKTPLEEAKKLIKEQSGKTLEEWSGQ